MYLYYGGLSQNVEIKPYIMDNEECDECLSACSETFCRLCLQYYCQICWMKFHHSLDVAQNSHGCDITDHGK
ncbi:hypothetical protein TELCIR_25408, partial [Teladorsagia circumcincta]